MNNILFGTNLIEANLMGQSQICAQMSKTDAWTWAHHRPSYHKERRDEK